MEDKIEISEETLRGLYLIMCGLPYDHSGSEVYNRDIPIMNKAHNHSSVSFSYVIA